MQRIHQYIVLLLALLLLGSCQLGAENIVLEDGEISLENTEEHSLATVTLIEDLTAVDYFRPGALEHILEGELNRKEQAVGYHYDRLPTKKGEIIKNTETEPNKYGVFEAEVEVNGVMKVSNQGMSSFFPNEWDTQEVVDAINEVYETREHMTGNTYGGLTSAGMHIQMYLDDQDLIISAFPVY